MTPVRVAFVITDSGIGGTEKVLLTLLRRMDRARFTPAGVVVLKTFREMGRAWAAEGVPVVELGMGRIPTPLLLLRLKRALAGFRPDVVSAFLFHAIQASRALRLASPNLYRLVTSPRVNYRFAPALARALDSIGRRLDDVVVTESESSRQALVSESGYDDARVQVAPNGVDTAVYRPDANARAELRREWVIPDDTVIVGAVGRLHHQKGFDLLLQALATIRSLPVKFQVVVAGDGPEAGRLRFLSERLGVPVRWLGNRNDVPRVLAATDIYVQSSRYEGLSNALLEAMSAGCACVATAVDGTRDIAEDGKNLLLVRPDDATALGVAIGLLLERGALRRSLAENAMITARSRSVDAMVNAFQTAFDRSLAKQ